MLDLNRFDSPAVYLAGDLQVRLVEVQHQCNILRSALTLARIELHRQADEVRVARWTDSVAQQDRAIGVETRMQHNIVEQTEADYEQMVQERELLMFLIGTT